MTQNGNIEQLQQAPPGTIAIVVTRVAPTVMGGDLTMGSVPDGGATDDVLTKASGANQDTVWAPAKGQLPADGLTGTVLTKVTDADQDANWVALPAPPPALPPAGAAGEVLGKATATDYDVAWIAAPPPSIPGGSTGRVLKKVSDADNDYAWGGSRIYVDAGMSFGSGTRTDVADTTNGITLWENNNGNPLQNFGLGMTSGAINIIAAASASNFVRLVSGAQPKISNLDGSAQRDIIDTTNGDVRYALKAHGDHVAANHGHSNYSPTNHGHARFDGVQWGNTSYLCQNPGNTEFAVRNAQNTAGQWAISAAWTVYSSADLKDNIADLPIERAVEAFDALRPVTFDYRDPPGPNVKPGQYGFVVEDMAQHPALASVVVGDYGYAPDSIIPLLVGKIRQLEAELDDLHTHTSNPRAPRRRRAK